MASERRSTGPEPQVYRVSEVARILRVSKDTVYRMVKSGELPHREIAGMVRIPVAAVRQKLEDGTDN